MRTLRFQASAQLAVVVDLAVERNDEPAVRRAHRLMSTAQVIARSLAEGPWALGSIRKLIWESLDSHWLQQLHAERVAQRTAGRTSDFREGVMAFLQKRVAVFSRK